MILRRITQHVQEQNWTAIALDFLIVVMGVYIGIQLGNWNEAQDNKDGVVNSLTRLRSEVETNIASANGRIERIQQNQEMRAKAVEAIRACDGSEEGLKSITDTIFDLSGDIVPSFINNTTKELARQDRYLDLLSNEFRAALNTYDSNLLDESEQLATNFNLMWDQHISTHPYVGIDIGEGEDAVAAHTLNAPMEEVCQDSVFGRRFIMTMMWHESTVMRLDRFNERSNEFLAVLDQELAAR